MEQFYAVFNQVILFFIIMIIGFCVVKFKLLSADYLPVISRFFTRVIVPFILFANIAGGATRADMINYSYLLIVNACIFAVLIMTTRILPKILKLKGNRASIFLFINSFGNVGFVGIPLLLAIYGQRAMIFVVMYTVVDQFLFWTYGVSLSFPVENRPDFSINMLKKMINPAVVAIILSFVIIMFNIRLPEVVERASMSMANTGSALPFIYMGGVVATLKIKETIRHCEFLAGIAIKMIILPICIFVVLRAIGIDPEIIGTTTILFGLPPVAMIPMLVSANGSDGEYATAAVIICTLASLFTLTFVSYITSMIL